MTRPKRGIYLEVTIDCDELDATIRSRKDLPDDWHEMDMLQQADYLRDLADEITHAQVIVSTQVVCDVVDDDTLHDTRRADEFDRLRGIS